MSLFVEHTEDEIGQFLVHFLASAPEDGSSGAPAVDSAATNQLLQLANEQNYLPFVEQSLALLKPKLLQSTQPSDLEACYHIIVSLLRHLLLTAPSAQLDACIVNVARSLTEEKTHMSQQRFKMMGVLFNLLDNHSPLKLSTFTELIDYAAATNQMSKLVPQLSRIQRWIDDWKLDNDHSRQLFLHVGDACKQSNIDSHAFDFYLRYLKTFQGANAQLLQSAQSQAVWVCIAALQKKQRVYTDDLLELSAVKALSNSQHKPLFELMTALKASSVENVQQLFAANQSAFQQMGLELEVLLQKTRLLRLSELAAENQFLPYSLVAEQLKISEEDVEEWIVDAVSTDSLEAKMDQDSRIIAINRRLHRVFSPEQWRDVRIRMSSWKHEIQNLLGAVQNIQEVKMGMTAGQQGTAAPAALTTQPEAPFVE